MSASKNSMKCEGHGCPLKKTCLRHLEADPKKTDYYFIESPQRKGKCEFFKDESKND
jgi:hypothetical protein